MRCTITLLLVILACYSQLFAHEDIIEETEEPQTMVCSVPMKILEVVAKVERHAKRPIGYQYIIAFNNQDEAKRVEMRFPDPAANGYLALSAMLMAGLDGIEKRIHPGDPSLVNLYEDENDCDYKSMSGSLEESLKALEEDHDYLLKGDVFSKDLLSVYIQHKKQEVEAYQRRPHPIELSMYYGC